MGVGVGVAQSVGGVVGDAEAVGAGADVAEPADVGEAAVPVGVGVADREPVGGDGDPEAVDVGVGVAVGVGVGVGVGDGDGDGEPEGNADVTAQRKLTEPAAPLGDVAAMVTWYVPDAADEMVPVISPLLLIDKPGGRFGAVNCGDCPSAALSDVTCNRIAVPSASCWLPGSSSRTAAWRK